MLVSTREAALEHVGKLSHQISCPLSLAAGSLQTVYRQLMSMRVKFLSLISILCVSSLLVLALLLSLALFLSSSLPLSAPSTLLTCPCSAAFSESCILPMYNNQLKASAPSRRRVDVVGSGVRDLSFQTSMTQLSATLRLRFGAPPSLCVLRSLSPPRNTRDAFA